MKRGGVERQAAAGRSPGGCTVAAIAAGVVALASAWPGTAAAPATLEEVARAVAAAPAWRVAFSQRYVPAGFETGASESGSLTLTPPASLRFDYAGDQPRVFAADGALARWVDRGAGSCTAVRLDTATWGRLPLTALLDPGVARAAFSVAVAGRTLTLTAVEPTPELERVVITVDDRSLPRAVTVVDGSGNRNEFTFTGWSVRTAPEPAFFRPALPGAAPCRPAEE